MLNDIIIYFYYGLQNVKDVKYNFGIGLGHIE